MSAYSPKYIERRSQMQILDCPPFRPALRPASNYENPLSGRVSEMTHSGMVHRGAGSLNKCLRANLEG